MEITGTKFGQSFIDKRQSINASIVNFAGGTSEHVEKGSTRIADALQSYGDLMLMIQVP